MSVLSRSLRTGTGEVKITTLVSGTGSYVVPARIKSLRIIAIGGGGGGGGNNGDGGAGNATSFGNIITCNGGSAGLRGLNVGAQQGGAGGNGTCNLSQYLIIDGSKGGGNGETGDAGDGGGTIIGSMTGKNTYSGNGNTGAARSGSGGSGQGRSANWGASGGGGGGSIEAIIEKGELQNSYSYSIGTGGNAGAGSGGAGADGCIIIYEYY